MQQSRLLAEAHQDDAQDKDGGHGTQAEG